MLPLCLRYLSKNQREFTCVHVFWVYKGWGIAHYMYLWMCIHMVPCMTVISPQLIHITTILSWLKFYNYSKPLPTHNHHLLMCCYICFHSEYFEACSKAYKHILYTWIPNGPMCTRNSRDKVQFEATFTNNYIFKNNRVTKSRGVDSNDMTWTYVLN